MLWILYNHITPSTNTNNCKNRNHFGRFNAEIYTEFSQGNSLVVVQNLPENVICCLEQK